MKWFSAPSILTLSLAGGLGHAEPSPSPAVLSSADADVDTTSDRSPPVAPFEGESHPFEPASIEPRGELVDLSKRPQAELLVDVLLTSNDENSYFELVSEKNGASLIVCGSPCQFQIWPGRYRVITNASSGYVGGSNSLMIDGNSAVVVHQVHVSRPALGAVLGVVGVATAILGGILFANNRCEPGCEAGTARNNRLGFAGMGVGLVAAPIGWLLFAQGRNPEVTISPIESR